MIIETSLFSLDAGRTHGVVGPNGVGKTTLLRQVAGQIPSERLHVFGEEPFDNRSVMDRTILMGIDNPLIEGWNVTKLLRLGAHRWKSWDQKRAEELLERFDLPTKNYSALSRGQKSAMGIVFAVASGCELMLLDEPYLGLDMDRQALFRDVLREEAGRTIVVSTHHLDELSGVLDTVVVLPSGLQGEIGELIDGILELTGSATEVDRALATLGVEPLTREQGALGERVIIDARSNPEQPYALDVRVQPVPLEKAVRALGGGMS